MLEQELKQIEADLDDLDNSECGTIQSYNLALSFKRMDFDRKSKERIALLLKIIKDLQYQIGSQNDIIDSLFSKIIYYENTIFTEGLRLEPNINSNLESVEVKEPDLKKISTILRENEMLKAILKSSEK